jgi:two-component system response regulator HydG
MTKILVVEDDVTFAKILERLLLSNGFTVEVAFSKKTAQVLLESNAFDLLLLDYRLPDGTGLEVFEAARNRNAQIPAIIMTSFNDVRTAVNAIRSGAFDYITKPVHHEELLMQINSAVQKREIIVDAKLPVVSNMVIGKCKASKDLYEQIKLIAPTNLSVIIHGETGTGKEHVARRIHEQSDRSKFPFVAIDCGTLSTEFAASELFGHLKGAFTGALSTKKGKFEEANRGTVFLDEIGNLSYDVQVKLLRVLQERIIVPLGSNKEIPIDIRIIAASNDDLQSAVSKGKFREDLFYRLNEFKISVPPLRERMADLPQFIDHFIIEANESIKRNVKGCAPEVIKVLSSYDWPGNVRELKNMIRRMVLLTPGEEVQMSALPMEMSMTMQSRTRTSSNDLKLVQEENEKALIEKVLFEVKFNKSKASKILNIDRSTLYAKMEKYGIDG